MYQNEISFIVTGPDAEIGANEIKEIINKEFAYDPQILTEKTSNRLDSTRSIDPVAFSALLLSIPGAILAVADIVSRIKNKEKLDKVLEKVNQQVIQKKNATVKVIYPNGMIKEIISAESSEILDCFSKKE
jgi:hypothetical protein